MICNYLTIDVEDYFQVHAFSRYVSQEDWGNYECRVEDNTRLILDILESNGEIKATFFILGWIAERYPKLVKDIYDKGHEIASHGYAHRVIYGQTPQEFREDIRVSRKILEDLTGDVVLGYRAPTYSITKKTLWALKVLFEEGYRYDSSIFPIRHDYYGMPEAPRFPFYWDVSGEEPQISDPVPIQDPLKNQAQEIYGDSKSGLVTEFPLSTVNIRGLHIPVSGGGYFRLFPYWLTRLALKRINREEKRPFIFYLHPWELDPDQPRFSHVGMLSRFRHYNNLHRTKDRFTSLLKDFSFSSFMP